MSNRLAQASEKAVDVSVLTQDAIKRGSRPLANSKHELFCQLYAAGEPAYKAYLGAGYSISGDDDTRLHNAATSASRLMATNDKVTDRCAYLASQLSTKTARKTLSKSIRLRSQRLDSLQDLSERHSKLIDARSRGETGLETGLVVRRVKQIGSGDNAQIVEEWFYDKAVVEESRNIGRQAAEELGEFAQKVVVERGDTPTAARLADALTLDELEEIESKIMERVPATIDVTPVKQLPEAPENTTDTPDEGV